MQRLASTLFFAAAFIWGAVSFFDVETEVVYVFFIFSLIFVAGAIVTGFLAAPLLHLMRRRKSSSLLSQVKADEDSG